MQNYSEELRDDVRNLKNAVFGNPENMKENPGVISELAQMNTSLREIRDALMKINWMLISGFVIALIAVVFKNLPSK